MKTIERILAGCTKLEKELKESRKVTIPKVNYPETTKVYYVDNAYYVSSKNQLKVDFIEREYYKKIDGYKTVNGVKHKILSDVLLKKEKIVTNTYEITPEQMLELEKYKDKQIKSEYELIYCSVQDVSVYPVKFQKMILKYYHEEELKRLAKIKPNPKELTKVELNPELQKEKDLEKQIKDLNNQIDSFNNKLISLQKKKISLGYNGKANFKQIVSLGINSYKKQMAKLDKETEATYEASQESYKSLFKAIEDIRNVEDSINDISYSIFVKDKYYQHQCELEEKMYERDQQNISCPYRERNQLTVSEKVNYPKPEVEYKYSFPNSKNCSFDLDICKYDDLYKMYNGYRVMALYIAKLKYNNYVVGISFDMGKSLEALYEHITPNKFECSIKLYVNKNELLDEFSRLEKEYNLEFMS